jgi:predicted tellurium resistance membrane protein TerC
MTPEQIALEQAQLQQQEALRERARQKARLRGIGLILIGGLCLLVFVASLVFIGPQIMTFVFLGTSLLTLVKGIDDLRR